MQQGYAAVHQMQKLEGKKNPLDASMSPDASIYP